MTVLTVPKLSRLGTHRVLEPPGALPQNAWRVDNTPIAFANEILCEVEALNIDSASFRQISEACDADPIAIGRHIASNVAARGKQHNSVTGSGGMFIGRVAAVGEALRDTVAIHEGDRIASLVSLTLTPLQIDKVTGVDVTTGRVWVEGKAILFECGLFVKLPDDIATDVALAVLDVAGAPAQVRRLAQPGQTVVVIGADGKSGMLSCAQAKARVGPTGKVVGIAPDAGTAAARLLCELGLVDDFIEADARDVTAVLEAIPAVIPHLADLVVNCVNCAHTELTSILCTRDHGTVYFFSMSTSFTAAALGAEGVGKDVTMIVGNGYAKGHADTALQTLRDHPRLLAYFKERYTPLSDNRHQEESNVADRS
ncbi:MAG: L-erythro-3,5-diaminohexanoate dehydrogenase [Candidatus Eremiobacteraeota bacterium]|nr:L-erythro-3,5-diaminohexanoate dehydrogenase [Candidatus Eremiobacteraeota bacterium]